MNPLSSPFPFEPSVAVGMKPIEPSTATSLMTVKQVAALRNVHAMSVYRAVWSQQLRSVRCGRAIRFRPQDVEAYINRRYECGPASFSEPASSDRKAA
jgi:excisionase family DNA binding protein